MVMTYLDGGLVKDVSEQIDVSISRAAKAVEFVLRDVAKRLESVSNEEDNPIKSSAMKDVARVVRKHARHTVNIFKENEMADRNYKKEYEEFHETPEQKKRRAQRNAARRKAMAAGKVKKGDGKEVDHIGAPRKGSLDGVPTQVISKKINRSKQPKRS
jgi:hypothetical protein